MTKYNDKSELDKFIDKYCSDKIHKALAFYVFDNKGKLELSDADCDDDNCSVSLDDMRIKFITNVKTNRRSFILNTPK
ncbi:MAG: hypothetical protein LBS99_03135 [Clostridiales bacterium]|jgi:hypothetical protein|nr:hypothetical protein [Clostridiales bacterium]